MIIEVPAYVDCETIKTIRESVAPFLTPNKSHMYNREGTTVSISKIPELKKVDSKLANIFTDVQKNILAERYKPFFNSGDSGYEYHLYSPNDICHIHSDGEFDANPNISNTGLLRYASVVLHLNTVKNGGELVFPTQNQKIKTEAGKIVIFPPYRMFEHYTTPSEEQREVIVTWFVYQGITVHIG
jgi:predicted 2-oxoglutarate/Fe(II)-dependent dioxygenase YbiX